MNAVIDMIPLEVRVQHPSAAALSRGAQSALALVESFEIVDVPTFEIGAEELKAIKAKAAALEEQRKAITKPMDDAKKAVMDLFRSPSELLAQAEAILKRKMLGYQQEQERIAAEARRKAEAEAAAERARIAADARKAEEAAQAERAAAAQAAQALQSATDTAERERLAGEIAQRAAETARLEGQAYAQREMATMVVAAPPAVAEPPKVAGVSTRTTIEFEVVDLHALVRAVAERPELIALLAVDSVKLRAYVRGLGMQTNLPGVRVFEKSSLSAARK